MNKTIYVRERELWKEARELADNLGISLSEFICSALKDEIDRFAPQVNIKKRS